MEWCFFSFFEPQLLSEPKGKLHKAVKALRRGGVLGAIKYVRKADANKLLSIIFLRPWSSGNLGVVCEGWVGLGMVFIVDSL